MIAEYYARSVSENFPYDAHGHSVFTKVFKEPKIYRDPAGIECAYVLPDVDFRLLKLFVLGVLWRHRYLA